ncbi:hypothetical protein X975_03821, partial [Stegodyphus mimosarum]
MFLLMDNSGVHPLRAKMADDYLENEDIHRMDLPARFLNFNPLEHGWDTLGRAISSRHHLPNPIPELKTSLLQEQDGVVQRLLICHMFSMLSRYATCLVVEKKPYSVRLICNSETQRRFWTPLHYKRY